MRKGVAQRSSRFAVGGVLILAIAIAIAAVFAVKAKRISDRPNVLELVQRDPRFKIFERIYEKSAFPSYGKVPGQWTVFAPVDSGFAKMPKDEVERALSDPRIATMVVQRHLLSGSFTSDALRKTNAVLNVRKYFLHIRIDDQKRVHVDNATIIEPDVMASNGVMHVLDYPLGSER